MRPSNIALVLAIPLVVTLASCSSQDVSNPEKSGVPEISTVATSSSTTTVSTTTTSGVPTLASLEPTAVESVDTFLRLLRDEQYVAAADFAIAYDAVPADLVKSLNFAVLSGRVDTEAFSSQLEQWCSFSLCDETPTKLTANALNAGNVLVQVQWPNGVENEFRVEFLEGISVIGLPPAEPPFGPVDAHAACNDVDCAAEIGPALEAVGYGQAIVDVENLLDRELELSDECGPAATLADDPSIAFILSEEEVLRVDIWLDTRVPSIALDPRLKAVIDAIGEQGIVLGAPVAPGFVGELTQRDTFFIAGTTEELAVLRLADDLELAATIEAGNVTRIRIGRPDLVFHLARCL